MIAAKNSVAESDDEQVLITRIFDAPRELVFKAWIEPEHLKRWYAPNGCTIHFLKLDVRPGGIYHCCVRSPEGHTCWCKGIYHEIVEPERIVYSALNTDEDGNLVNPVEVGMDPEWPRETMVTVTFMEHEGKTKVILHQTAPKSIAKRTGAYSGWIQMLDHLAEDLKTLKATF